MAASRKEQKRKNKAVPEEEVGETTERKKKRKDKEKHKSKEKKRG
jgi:hypothetical protein